MDSEACVGGLFKVWADSFESSFWGKSVVPNVQKFAVKKAKNALSEGLGDFKQAFFTAIARNVSGFHQLGSFHEKLA